jgi:serine/threonine protein kinase
MTGHAVGNPAYMAPETILQGVLDPRTDLYALGVTLYELAAGRRPFPGTTLAEMLHAHVQGRPDPLERHRPDAPLGLRRFIERLLARDADERYQSAEQALNALRSSLAAWPDPPAMAIPVGRPVDLQPRGNARKYVAFAAAGLGAVALGALLGLLLR